MWMFDWIIGLAFLTFVFCVLYEYYGCMALRRWSFWLCVVLVVQLVCWVFFYDFAGV